MNKQQILDEIKRLAGDRGGKPPGEKLFASETGLRQHEWRGKYWLKWGDALREAGLEPNKWKEAIDETLLVEKYIQLIREVGRIPSSTELLMKVNTDPSYPSMAPFKRLGGKAGILRKLESYCRSNGGYDDILALCENSTPVIKSSNDKKETDRADEFVYLIKSGRYYKVGRSVSVGQRERQLAIQLPEKAETVHSIRTDDSVGIEAYWHRRFGPKRKNGEWFDLDGADIKAFKRRKFM